MPAITSAIAAITLVGMALSGCGHKAQDPNSTSASTQNGAHNEGSESQVMSDKMRPWDRKDVKVYRPDPVSSIEYDAENQKAVDTATGDFIIMHPPFRESPGQYIFGNATEGIKAFGGYTGGWFPEERVAVDFINAVSLRSNPTEKLSRSEYDASSIARMMRGFEDAQRAADPHFAKIRQRSPPIHIVVIDTRPETPAEK